MNFIVGNGAGKIPPISAKRTPIAGTEVLLEEASIVTSRIRAKI